MGSCSMSTVSGTPKTVSAGRGISSETSSTRGHGIAMAIEKRRQGGGERARESARSSRIVALSQNGLSQNCYGLSSSRRISFEYIIIYENKISTITSIYRIHLYNVRYFKKSMLTHELKLWFRRVIMILC